MERERNRGPARAYDSSRPAGISPRRPSESAPFEQHTMRISSVALSLLLLAAPLAAQQPAATPARGPEPVDRVLAVVGDTVLLLSDVQAAIGQMEAAGQPIPPDAAGRAALMQEVMQSRISDLIVIEAAKDANVTIDETELVEQVDANIRAVQQRYGTDQAFDAALLSEGL